MQAGMNALLMAERNRRGLPISYCRVEEILSAMPASFRLRTRSYRSPPQRDRVGAHGNELSHETKDVLLEGECPLRITLRANCQPEFLLTPGHPVGQGTEEKGMENK